MSESDHRVLVASTSIDPSTDLVVAVLRKRGVDCVRINTEEFPFASRLTSEFVEDNDAPVISYSIDGVTPWRGHPTSIWYRRVRSPACPESMSTGIYDFCLREARASLLGALLSQSARIMSRPEYVWAAEQKIYQLSVAKQVGLPIPQTTITNEPIHIREAYHRFGGRLIIKPARTGFVDLGDRQAAIYTSRILEEHLEHLHAASLSPAIYQELIEKRSDVRATYVGGRFFVAEIDSQSDPAATLDWRQTTNPDLPHRLIELPANVQERLETLMSMLNLNFGAVDLIRTAEDRYVFLEVNPNGQWLWIDDKLDTGITNSIVEWLIGKA